MEPEKNMNQIKEQVQQKFKYYVDIRTNGCSKSLCSNDYCAKNPKIKKLNEKEAAQEALILMNNNQLLKIQLCTKTIQLKLFKEFLQKCQQQNNYQELQDYIMNSISTQEQIINSFQSTQNNFDEKINLTLDSLGAQEFFATILKGLNNYDLQQKIKEIIDNQMHKMVLDINSDTFSDHIANLKNYILLENMENEGVYNSNQAYINEQLMNICKLMKFIFQSNQQKNRVEFSLFYVDNIYQNEELFVKYNYYWYIMKQTQQQQNQKNAFTYLDYPFLLILPIKQKFLQNEMHRLQHQNQQKSIQQQFQNHNQFLLGFMHNLYSFIKVRREFIVDDTMNSIAQSGFNFKLPLKIVFQGEQGVDEGGVKNEFFMLMTRQLLNVDYGMFVPQNNNQCIWFNKIALVMPIQFELVGIILGLAIYNNIILDAKFPQLVYKKLLNENITLEDIAELDYDVYKSIKNIQTYEGDLEKDLAVNFEVSYEEFSEIKKYSLKENGQNIPVTNQNKQEFIDLYIDWIVNKSIEHNYIPFSKGFQKVVEGDIIKMLTSSELQRIIIGQEIINLLDLKENAQYMDGYDKNSIVCQWLWEILDQFPQEQQKKFLLFCTGTDRAPVRGLTQIKLKIVRQRSATQKLPSACTCFHHLFLPEYETKDKLREKLVIAINNSEGFGLM